MTVKLFFINALYLMALGIEWDISRARELFGWEPRHRLLDTLPAIVAKLQENPLNWYKENKLDPPAALEKV